MSLLTSNDFQNFCDELRLNLGLHHQLYDSVCKDVYLEELTSKSFKSIGYNSDWIPDFSHSPGKDQSLNNYHGISNKSGMIIKQKGTIKIKISGSRTSKYETLGAKLNFLQQNNYDYILGCGTNKEEIDQGIKRYYCYLINSNEFDFFDMDWEEDIDKKGNKKWFADNKNGIEANIGTISTSNQFWLTIDKRVCKYFTILEIDF